MVSATIALVVLALATAVWRMGKLIHRRPPGWSACIVTEIAATLVRLGASFVGADNQIADAAEIAITWAGSLIPRILRSRSLTIRISRSPLARQSWRHPRS